MNECWREGKGPLPLASVRAGDRDRERERPRERERESGRSEMGALLSLPEFLHASMQEAAIGNLVGGA